MISQTISHYRILGKLGEGGMGVVYKAEDTKLRRTVALKFLPSHATENRERFLREAQAAAALNHPNICTIFEIDEEHTFLAMELIEGVSLRDRIAERPLPLDVALDLAIQTCQGLHAAHEKGVVHRDIKPANLMINEHGQVKIMDFGLAQVGDRTRITKTGSSMGTPAYMSPEQVQGEPADRRSDIWSLGVVLYEMLTGRMPFAGETEQAVSYGIVHGNPEPVTALRSGLPVQLDRIVAKAMAKRSEQRYQNVADLMVDLRAVAATGQTALTTKKRLHWPYALAASVFLAVAGYFAWRGAAPPQSIRSIAILPLRSLTQEATDSFLGLGIADALITKIGQTGQMRVRPISAVRRYAKGETDPIEAARQLETEAVLDGSLQQSGDRIRVSVHLLRTGTGETIWTQSFDVKSGDVFAVQDEIAKEVAGQLRLKLDPNQRRDFEKRYTSNAEAFHFYSKAMYHLDNRTRREELQLAIELLKKAIELDPSYALARAQLGYAYAWRAVFQVEEPKLIEYAQLELTQAEKMDPRIAHIHVARSFILWSQYEHWKVREAIQEMRVALQLDPNAGHTDLAAYYWHIGLESLAEKHHQLALAAEPNSEVAKVSLINEFYESFRPDEGAAAERRLFRREPGLRYYLMKGMTREAEPLIEKAYLSNPKNLANRLNRAQLWVLQGKTDAARKEISSVEPEAERAPRLRQFHHRTYSIARIFARLGDAAKARYWLQLTVDTGFPQYPMMERDRMLDPVRKDPEVAKLLASVKSLWENYQREFGDQKRP